MRRSVFVVVGCLARTVHADPDPKQEQAQALYAEGSTHYNLREYAQAIDAFKRAYELFPEPTFLFDIAQAYRLLHDCDNAAAFYRNYIRVKPDAEDRDKTEKLAAEMDTCAADERRAREDEKRRQQPVAPPVAAPLPSSQRGLRLAGYITAGAGVALAAGGVYFTLDARDKASRIEQLCMTSCNANDVASIDESGKSSSQLAVVMYVTGGLAVAAGTGMIVWATLHADPEKVTVAPTRGGATVSTTLHF